MGKKKEGRALARPGSILIAWLACAAVVLAVQDPQKPPVFTSRVDVVPLDVSVLDKNKQPVLGLTAADFLVKEDGKATKIVAFEAVNIESPPPPPVAWMRDVTPDVTTNTIQESRLVVIVVDDALIPMDPRVIKDSKRVITDVINRLSPTDYTAVIFTADNRKAQDFTHDRATLLASLDRFNPGMATWKFGMDNPTGLNGDAYFYVSSVRTLERVAEYLMAVPQRRKALIWISPGIPMDAELAIAPKQITAIGGGAPGTSMANRDVMMQVFEDTKELFRRAQRANVAVYPIDATGFGVLEQMILQMYIGAGLHADAAQALAHQHATEAHDFVLMTAANTGGHAILDTNDFGPGVEQIFRENSSYYLLGFQPANPKQDGGLRRIQVEVNRPGVEVRTRSMYEASRPEQTKTKNKVSPEAMALGKAIGGVLPETDLPMGVTLAPFALPGSRTAAVAIALGVRQPLPPGDAGGQRTEKTELQVSAFTPEGDARGTQRHTATIKIRPGATTDAEYEVLGRIDLAPGRYRLRLAAHNASTDKTGSVPADIVIPDFTSDPFSISGVVIGKTPAKASAPKDLLAAILPLVPTSEREFGVTDKVTAFLRLYQSGKKPMTAASLAIRISDAAGGTPVRETRTIALDAFVAAEPPQTDPRGMPARGGQSAQKPDPFANAWLRTADVTYVIPIAKLTPGQTLLTFEATVGTTTLRRDVRFTVK